MRFDVVRAKHPSIRSCVILTEYGIPFPAMVVLYSRAWISLKRSNCFFVKIMDKSIPSEQRKNSVIASRETNIANVIRVYSDHADLWNKLLTESNHLALVCFPSGNFTLLPDAFAPRVHCASLLELRSQANRVWRCTQIFLEMVQEDILHDLRFFKAMRTYFRII